VLTLTLTGLAADSWLADGNSPEWGGALPLLGSWSEGGWWGAAAGVDVALPVLVAALAIALATAELRFGAED
jgi:hypothetical protein